MNRRQRTGQQERVAIVVAGFWILFLLAGLVEAVRDANNAGLTATAGAPLNGWEV